MYCNKINNTQALGGFQSRVFLGIILVSAFLIRIYGINFGLPGLFNPDENIYVEGAFRVASGKLDPLALTQGSLTYYLLALFYGLSFLFQKAAGIVDSPAGFLLTNYIANPAPAFISARLFIALLAVAGVYLTYRLARDFFGVRAGIISALLLSFSYIHVQQSHFIKDDIIASLLLLIAFLFLSRTIYNRPNQKSHASSYYYIFGGLFLGLAIACKYISCAGIAFLLVFHIMGNERRNFRILFFNKHLWISIIFLILGFIAAEPFALINFSGLSRAILLVISKHNPNPAFGLNKGWQPTILFYLTEYLKNGVGFYVMLAIFAGLIIASRIDFKKALSLASFPFCLLIVLSLFRQHVAYYILTALPFSLIFAGVAVDQLFLRIKPGPTKYLCVALLLALFMLTSFLDCLRFGFFLSQPDTRIQAKKWVEDVIPADSKILVEGSYGGIIAAGPPLEANLYALNRELEDIKKKGGGGKIWQLRLSHLQKNYSGKRYNLYKTLNITTEDLREHNPDYVIISGYYNYPIGYLLMSIDRRNDILEFLRGNYTLLKKFAPFPDMDRTPHLIFMDFDKFRKIPVFDNHGNRVIQGPTIEIYKRI